MKKSTEFVFQLLVTILEPLITLLGHLLDSREKEKNDANDTEA